MQTEQEVLRLVERLRLRSGDLLAGGVSSALERYTSHPMVGAFLADLRKCAASGQLDFSESRDFALGSPSGLVLSVFSAPYNEHLGLDAFAYRPVEIEAFLSQHFPDSAALAVTLLGFTAGFAHEESVALFPENFIADREPSPDHKIFYFVDRFRQRFETVTLPALHFGTGTGFETLLDLLPSEVISLSAAWVHLHEYFHKKGFLPLPAFLKLKSTKTAAALEEVRVDAASILACAHHAQRGEHRAATIAQFILAERLLRYPLMSSPDQNYDSRSSQLLLQYLCSHEAAFIEGGKLSIDWATLPHVLKQLLVLVNKYESRLRDETGPLRRKDGQHIDAFALLAGLNGKTAKFERVPYFEDLRSNLQKRGTALTMRYAPSSSSNEP